MASATDHPAALVLCSAWTKRSPVAEKTRQRALSERLQGSAHTDSTDSKAASILCPNSLWYPRKKTLLCSLGLPHAHSLFWNKVICIPVWLWTHHTVKNDKLPASQVHEPSYLAHCGFVWFCFLEGGCWDSVSLCVLASLRFTGSTYFYIPSSQMLKACATTLSSPTDTSQRGRCLFTTPIKGSRRCSWMQVGGACRVHSGKVVFYDDWCSIASL